MIEITSQIHIQKFETLHFSDHKIKMIQNFSVQKSLPHQSKGENAPSNQFHSQISKFSDVSLGSDFYHYLRKPDL